MKKSFTHRILKLGNRSIIAAIAAIGFPAFSAGFQIVTSSRPLLPSTPILAQDSLYKKNAQSTDIPKTDPFSDEFGVALYGCPPAVDNKIAYKPSGYPSADKSEYFNLILGKVSAAGKDNSISDAKAELIYNGKVVDSARTDYCGDFCLRYSHKDSSNIELRVRITPEPTKSLKRYQPKEFIVKEIYTIVKLDSKD